MSIEQFVKDELILLNERCSDQDQFFQIIFNKAFNNGYVDEMFLTKIKERETVFPTGLKMNDYSVAIPHTDPEYVKEQFIAVVTLEEPIKFHLMDDASKLTDVKLIFVLGLNQPHNQIEALQQLMEIIQNRTIIEELLSAKSSNEIHLVFSQREGSLLAENRTF